MTVKIARDEKKMEIMNGVVENGLIQVFLLFLFTFEVDRNWVLIDFLIKKRHVFINEIC